MADAIKLTTYEGTEIYVNNNGTFTAEVDDAGVYADTLVALQEKIHALGNKTRKSRKLDLKVIDSRNQPHVITGINVTTHKITVTPRGDIYGDHGVYVPHPQVPGLIREIDGLGKQWRSKKERLLAFHIEADRDSRVGSYRSASVTPDEYANLLTALEEEYKLKMAIGRWDGEPQS